MAVGGEVKGLETVYFFESENKTDSDSVTKLYKFGLGPVEVTLSYLSLQIRRADSEMLKVSIAYDLETKQLVLHVFLTIPIIGTVLVGSVTGSLQTGVSIKIGYGSILGGELGVKLQQNNAFLTYKFKAFGKEYGGQVKVF